MDKIEILQDLKESLRNQFGAIIDIDKVVLFGSQANGGAKKDSDFDILIVLNSDYDWRLKNEILGVCCEIDLKYDIITDVTIISRNEMKTLRGKQPFIRDAMEQGIGV